MIEDVARDLQEIPEKIKDEVNRANRDATTSVIRHIQQRTARGIGTNGRRFANYRPSTARRKGRTQPVTLRASTTRSMLDDLAASQAGLNRGGYRNYRIRLRSREKERIGRFHQSGTRRMAKREWFGVTLRFAREHFSRVNARINRILPRDRRRRDEIIIGL